MGLVKQRLLLAAGSLVCVAVALHAEEMFGGTEFGGGTLARNEGPALLLFVVALVLVVKFPRVASASALVGSALSLPLYVYLVFPRPFRRIWPGEWKTLELPRETFAWDAWWVAGILAILFVAGICIWILVGVRGSRGSAAGAL
jgi:hypothetical protein